jgi:hypothetical protein
MSDKSSNEPPDGQSWEKNTLWIGGLSTKDGRPSPDTEIEFLMRERMKLSDIEPHYQIKVEIIDSGVFQDGKFEGRGKPIPDIENLVFIISTTMLHSSPQFTQEKILAPAFDDALAKLTRARDCCHYVDIGVNEADNLLNRLRKLREKVLRKFTLNYRYETADHLIVIISNFLAKNNTRISDRTLSRVMERLLKIPSVNDQMITDEAVRKRISKLRKEGRIPKIGG